MHSLSLQIQKMRLQKMVVITLWNEVRWDCGQIVVCLLKMFRAIGLFSSV